MTTKRINELVTIAVAELKQESENLFNEKICLIEDIFKAKKHAWALGVSGHYDVFSSPGQVFDSLYDQPIEQLQLIWATISAEMSQAARIKAGLANPDCCNSGGCDCE